MAEPTEEVVGCAPLRRRWGRSRSRGEKPSAVMAAKKQGSYLEEDGGSGQIRSASPRLTLQLRGGNLYLRASKYFKTQAQGRYGAYKGSCCA